MVNLSQYRDPFEEDSAYRVARMSIDLALAQAGLDNFILDPDAQYFFGFWAKFREKFGNSHSKISRKEAEMLLDPKVNALIGKGYMILRKRGVIDDLTLEITDEQRINFLMASANLQFGGKLPEEDNKRDDYMAFISAVGTKLEEYLAQTYSNTQLPLEVIFDLEDAFDAQGIIRQIMQTSAKPAGKNFPLGKTYITIPVTGLMESLDPVMATKLLVYGLIGKNKKNLESAYRAFDREKLVAGREQIKNSHLSSEKIFNEIKQHLAKLDQHDVEAATNILFFLRESIRTEEISDLVAGVEYLLNGEEQFSHLRIKMQDGTLDDLYDNRSLMCCSFLPNGLYRQVSAIYHSDPDIGLLHLVPEFADKKMTPIGVSILANACDGYGNKWLVVDSSERGEGLLKVRENLWIPELYDSILSVGKDVSAKYVIFNSTVFNGGANHFNSYAAKKSELSAVHLVKNGIRDFSHLGISENVIKEALESWKDGFEGEVNGYVVDLSKVAA